MYIQSIVLDGFKSYGQRTEVNDFDDKFTAITGLNGSGKSNILDAICFVLGITNLSHVRVGNLQELIFKQGQAGVNKATVSIIFNNSNPAQCPPGFENFKEITVTRQIIMGGKNKYLINGSNVTNKVVQDLFCSVQLNVNNPHFLIMQGKITKVLNMKPSEILAMLEEAAGTRMYEVKRQVALKTIEKKDAKLLELQAIISEEITPKLNKLKEERAHYLEFLRMERELVHMLGVHVGWQYHISKKSTRLSEKALTETESKVKAIKDNIEDNKNAVEELDKQIENMMQSNKSDIADQLKNLEEELKEKSRQEAKMKAAKKGINDDISVAKKKKETYEKTLIDDGKVLSLKENDLNKVKLTFETLKENTEKDKELFSIAQKKYEAVAAGMEVNEDGEAQTLQEQLIRAQQQAAEANTDTKNINMELSFYKNMLKEKENELKVSNADGQADNKSLEKVSKECKAIETALNKISYSAEGMDDLKGRKQELNRKISQLREKVDRFEAARPYTQFRYTVPDPNFNKNGIHGMVCKLFQVRENETCTALETAAGGRLYNVVVDTESTSKYLLQRGNLQNRTTFIPLNKIQTQKMNDRVIALAQNLVGKENVQPALSLINYDRKLQPVMEYIFGNVFICKDMNVAKQVTFHNQIRKKCVTLDGDVTDPSGTLSGGAREKGASILLEMKDIQHVENQLQQMEHDLQQIEFEIQKNSTNEREYTQLKHQWDIKQYELGLLQQRLQQTEHHKLREEVDNLKQQIEGLLVRKRNCQEQEGKANKQAKDLESKIKDSKGYRQNRLKDAEKEMKAAEKKATKSQMEWEKNEGNYQTFTLEISELKTGLENTKNELEKTIESIEKLNLDAEEAAAQYSEINKEVTELGVKITKTKKIISSQNREMQNMTTKKEQLIQKNEELALDIKKISHKIEKLENDIKNCKGRESDLAKKVKNDNQYLQEGAKLTDKEGQDLEKRIKEMQEIKNKLGRKINTKAQTMFEQEEKQYQSIRKRQNIVENDKRKLLTCMTELDKKKKESLKLAIDQVSKDFGSIFNTLLPGANARLAAPQGMSILEGVEVQVCLGSVWKESLTELSGGQRSLAALSLILAMLLFKPAPLYILDEVDAALDLSHTQNIGNMLKIHFKKSQFVIVSLKDGMFSNADVLFTTKFVDGVSTITRKTNRNKC